MKRNYQGAIERIKTIALAHPQIKSADEGRELEFDVKKANQWPRAFIRTEQSNVIGGDGSVVLTVSFTILIMDRLNARRSNTVDVMNLTHAVMTDVLAQLNYEQLIQVEDGLTMEPLYDYSDTQTAGWQCRVDIYLDSGFQCYTVATP